LTAQDQQDSLKWYQLQIDEDLPLEEAAKTEDIHFFAANRQLDSLKAIALNVNVLTASELASSGVTNIPEALQLLPDFVVKAKANGLYQVGYRGAPAPSDHWKGSESLLLLINAEPYNDALTGEIWWEALPLSVEDLEQIEVISSPQGTWFGYGGALAVVNLVTKKPALTKNTMFSAKMQAGTFNTHYYQADLGMQFNERLSGRVGASYQHRNRFQHNYYIQSLGRYLVGDSILFYQPEAYRTNPDTKLAQNARVFDIALAYQWNDSISIMTEVVSQNSEAQGVFNLQEEIRATVRQTNTQVVNVVFDMPSAHVHAFYQSGERNFAVGYSGLHYQMRRSGLRVAHRKNIGDYYLIGGVEWLNNQYDVIPSVVPSLSLNDSLQTVPHWDQNLLSLYLQQKMPFANGRLLFESGQRIYHRYSGQALPFGFHAALRWYLNQQTSVSASTSQVLQSANHLFIQDYEQGPIRITHHDLSLRRQINRKQGSIRFSIFNQHTDYLTSAPLNDAVFELPNWGGNVEVDYRYHQLLLQAHASWWSTDKNKNSFHPPFTASLQTTYATFFNKLNLTTGFFFYQQHQHQMHNQSYTVPDQWILHGKCSYRVWRDYELFVSVRNATNQQIHAVPLADRDHRLLMFGLSIKL